MTASAEPACMSTPTATTSIPAVAESRRDGAAEKMCGGDRIAQGYNTRDADALASSPRPLGSVAPRLPDGAAPVTDGSSGRLWRTPGGRGFIMLAVMSAALGFAMNAHNNVVTNYFDEVLHLSGPQFGYITAVREVGGFVLIFLTASLYRISLQRVTAGALVVLALGYALFSL